MTEALDRPATSKAVAANCINTVAVKQLRDLGSGLGWIEWRHSFVDRINANDAVFLMRNTSGATVLANTTGFIYKSGVGMTGKRLNMHTGSNRRLNELRGQERGFE